MDVPEDVEAGGRAGDGDVSGQLEEQAGQTRHWYPGVGGHSATGKQSQTLNGPDDCEL